MLAISFNFLNTPPAVRLAGWNIIRWLLRELSATRPKSPFSWASALILSNCRPGNKSQMVNSSRLARWWAEKFWHQPLGWECTSKCLGATEWFYVCVRVFYRLLEQQLSSAPSLQRQAPSPGMQDPAGSNTGTHSTAGRLETEHTHILLTQNTSTVTYTNRKPQSQKHRSTKRSTNTHTKPRTCGQTRPNTCKERLTQTWTYRHRNTPPNTQTKNRQTNTHTHHRSPTGICSHTHALTHPPTFMCNLASSSSPW